MTRARTTTRSSWSCDVCENVVTRLIKSVRLALDANDLFFLAGSIAAVTGGCLVSVRWTLVVAGVALVAIGLFGLGGGK